MWEFLLVLILVFSVCSAECPAMCTCRTYPADIFSKSYFFYNSVSCDGFNNDDFILSNTTRSLEITNLNATTVGDFINSIRDYGSELPFLNSLTISRSGIQEANVSLNGFDQIHSLTLNENDLKKVPKNFLNLTALNFVDLSRNEIQELDNIPFRTLRTLKVLNLSANHLSKIETDSFSGLNNLKCLDLSNNKLTDLDDNVFSSLSSLQSLNLSHNRLEALNEMSFSGLITLQQIDVSWNDLTRVAPSSLELPSLTRLVLAGNPRLGGSREVLIGTGRRLQAVDVSETGLKQVPAALTHSVRTLRMAGNSIQTVGRGDLDSYPLIQLLDFTSNSLETVEYDAFGRLDSLSVLYLSDNNIHEIPKSLPDKLNVLHLERNKVEKISRDDLQGLTTLEVLLLSDNKIKVIGVAAFSQLTSLVTLDLSRNPLTILQPGCLSGPAALQVLRLSSIGAISPAEEVSFPLPATEHLITLDLSDSPGLGKQFLADTAALAAARELRELDLSGTDLEFVRYDLLHYLPLLTRLHLKRNRLNCTELQWLAVWMRRQDEQEYSTVVCANPVELWGAPLIDLQYDISYFSTKSPTINTSPKAILVKENAIHDNNSISEVNDNTNVSPAFNTSPTAILKENTINGNKTSDKVNDKRRVLRILNTNPKAILVNENITANNKTYKINENTKVWNLLNQINNSLSFGIMEKEKVTYNLTNKKSRDNIPETSKNQYDSNMLNKRKFGKSFMVNTRKITNKVILTKAKPSSVISDKDSSVSALKVNHTAASALSLQVTPTRGIINQPVEEEISKLDTHLVHYPPDIEAHSTLDGTPNQPLDDQEKQLRSEALHLENVSEKNDLAMYTNKERQARFLHPGMLILAVGAVCSAAALVMLAVRLGRKKRSDLSQQEDIEVASLPSVTELW